MLVTRALLLDMDGLMVDSEPLWFEVERDFLAARGGTFTREMADACMGRGLAATLRTMRASHDFELDVERDGAEVVDRFIAHVGALELMPGCLELLDAARGRVGLALASSSSRRLVDAVVARFELGRWLDAVVSGDDVTHPKPAPDIFLEAAQRLNVTAADSVVLEDSLAGVESGRAAGMSVIAVPFARTTAFEALATHVVADLHEARALLTWG
jgi:mannitol-1-/sugar-/sorbitol-6-/2-deoxyglucose-6-phosphatase